MKPSMHIKPPEWMAAPDVERVFSALDTGNSVYDKGTKFVGGCVRDTILGLDSVSLNLGVDIDLATVHPPDKVVSLLQTVGIKVVPTGIDHGSITAVLDTRAVEITTLRRDVETDGRHAKVDFTEDWLADAQRRDFTINALYADPDGVIYDPVGGLRDLEAGYIRFIGNAADRIEEDALRILRFFRFVAFYATRQPDKQALSACANASEKLSGLSAERVTQEIFRLLVADNPLPALDAMAATGVLQIILPEATRMETLGVLRELEVAAGFGPDAILRLASLLYTPEESSGALASKILGRFKLSKKDHLRFLTLIKMPIKLTPDMDCKNIHVVLYKFGYRAFVDALFVTWAREGPDQDYSTLVNTAAQWDIPKFPLFGADVYAEGVSKGPEIGKFLAEVETWWIENDFVGDRRACLERLRILVN